MIKLVVYDWNGTLLADAQAVLEGVNNELGVLNRPPMTMREYREHYDVPIAEFYKNIGVRLEVVKANSAQMAKAFHAYYEPRVARARTRSGTKRVLETLKTTGKSQVILSNHTTEGIYLQLQRLRLAPYFDMVLANEIIGLVHFVGKQGRLEEYLATQKIQPSSVVIVGDTLEEIKIGKSLGLKTIAITGGYNSTKRLKAAKPDVLIHTLSEIINAVEDM